MPCVRRWMECSRNSASLDIQPLNLLTLPFSSFSVEVSSQVLVDYLYRHEKRIAEDRALRVDCVRDIIPYVHEMLDNQIHLAEDAKTKLELRGLLLMYEEVTNQIKSEMKARGREDDFVGWKVSLVSLEAACA